MAMQITTTDSVVTENIYKLKREPQEAARDIDNLDLTIKPYGANKHEVAGEVFPNVELAGEYVRKLRAIARKLKADEQSAQ
jgi:hypothetical protein